MSCWITSPGSEKDAFSWLLAQAHIRRIDIVFAILVSSSPSQLKDQYFFPLKNTCEAFQSTVQLGQAWKEKMLHFSVMFKSIAVGSCHFPEKRACVPSYSAGSAVACSTRGKTKGILSLPPLPIHYVFLALLRGSPCNFRGIQLCKGERWKSKHPANQHRGWMQLGTAVV